MANLAAVAIHKSPLSAITIETPAEKCSLFKIAFKGFDSPNHWVFARTSTPFLFVKHKYTLLNVNLDDIEQSVWVLKEELVAKFKSSPSEIRVVFQHIHELYIHHLHSLVSCCTTDQISKYDLQQMILVGRQHSKNRDLSCLKGETVRTVIAGEDQSYILFTKHNTRKDFLYGGGSTKRVKPALSIDRATIYAVGVCRRDILEDADWELISNEVDLLKQVKGIQGILQIETALETDNKFYIITEFLNQKDLQRVFDEMEELDFGDKLQIALDISLGLLNLHYLKILHRDLKPSNLLLDFEKTPRKKKNIRSVIGDLGSACKIDAAKLIQKRTGTIVYMAPEKIPSAHDAELTQEWVERSTPKADIWSLGLIFFSLFHPKMGTLMNFQNAKELEFRIHNLEDEEIEEEIRSSGIHPLLCPILIRMLQTNPKNRCDGLWVYKAIEEIFDAT